MKQPDKIQNIPIPLSEVDKRISRAFSNLILASMEAEFDFWDRFTEHLKKGGIAPPSPTISPELPPDIPEE